MIKILGLSGSLRRGSHNTALLRAAAEMMPEGSTLDIATIEGIPIYNGDDETETGIPPAVRALKDRVVGADGLLIASPEYNNSVPGGLKNAMDWLSRPQGDSTRVFNDRPVAVTGASTGMFGTTLGQTAWLPVLRTLRMNPWFSGRLLVPRAQTLMDENGNLTDETLRKNLAEFVTGFVDFVRASTR